jgi:hypothetical protein
VVDSTVAHDLAATAFDDESPFAQATLGALTPAYSLVIAELANAVRSGTPWSRGLVEAVGRWGQPREVVDGDEVTYLIAGEAFDWLRLAERLLRGLEAELPGAVPADEWEHLLFRGVLPEALTQSIFQEALGVDKYRAHLNFFYGVVVEEALWHAVEREVHKERGVRGLQHPHGEADVVCQRLYRADLSQLLRRFRKEREERSSVKFSLTDWKAFTYWLFKLRVGRNDTSRTASDTRKGLLMLEELQGYGELTRL